MFKHLMFKHTFTLEFKMTFYWKQKIVPLKTIKYKKNEKRKMDNG